MSHWRSTARTAAAVAAVAVAACRAKAPEEAAVPPPIDVAPENIAIVDSAMIETGPSLSGTLTAEHAAQLRAQVAGALLGVYVDEGAAVTAGQPVALIDTLTLAEAARSARSQLSSAQLSAEVARRNYERSVTLHNAGAIADRDLETAHNQSAAADAAVADATSKLATAEKQLANTTVRAPFRGVVSERPASTGDILQVGTPILTIVDPTALQLEASIAAEYLGNIKIGTKVVFSVNGNPGHTFTGRIARINPTVDSVTRQMRLYITVPNQDRTLAAGLFAQGRVTVTALRTLALPLAVLDAGLSAPAVKRVRGGKVESVPVTLGLRDDLAERVQVTSGVAYGDTLLAGAALTTPAGSHIHLTPKD